MAEHPSKPTILDRLRAEQSAYQLECVACDSCGELRPFRYAGVKHLCERCWDPIATLELRIHEMRCLVAGYDDERLATLPAPERRLIEETRLHLAEYDRAKSEEASDG